jgi:hypothetical protein
MLRAMWFVAIDERPRVVQILLFSGFQALDAVQQVGVLEVTSSSAYPDFFCLQLL